MRYSSLNSKRRSVLRAGTGLAAIALSSGAFAQDTDNEEDPAVTVTTEEAPVAEAIVVTGSRITSVTPFNSPDPISIVSPEVAR